MKSYATAAVVWKKGSAGSPLMVGASVGLRSQCAGGAVFSVRRWDYCNAVQHYE